MPLAQNVAEYMAGCDAVDREVISTYEKPVQEKAGFLVLKGNLFDFAIMKTSVISPEFRNRYLGEGDSFECRAVVFEGSTDYHERINDPALGIDEHTILVIRGSGPLGWPGSAEVVNMQPPDALLKRGILSLPDARRWPAIGNIGQPLDSQLFAGKCRGWRTRVAAHRR